MLCRRQRSSRAGRSGSHRSGRGAVRAARGFGALAPECGLASVRVLGAQATGGGSLLLAGLRWAIREGYDVVNLSLSTRRPAVGAALHTLADEAYFARSILVASAHNLLVESYPWRFAAVISVASHESPDPQVVYA